MNNKDIPQAALVIIGNEILSGRTKDTNLAWLGQELNLRGIRLLEGRVIPDIESVIVETVNELCARYDYVFTTGGIGPTHDDITTASVAKAFGRAVVRNPEAEAMLQAHYGSDLNAARLKMADLPENVTLIPNPVSAAPGFQIENVYVMAGVPRIMQAMFDAIKHSLRQGSPMLSRTVSVYLTEGVLAERLAAIQLAHPDVEIGSYPFIRQGRLGSSLVARATETPALEQCYKAIRELVQSLGGEIAEDAA